MKLSLELVPNAEEKLMAEVMAVKEGFPQIDMVNIPDLLRYDLRSWDACKMTKPYYNNSIPHIRAIDFDYNQPLPFVEKLRENHIDEVLVINGDPPTNMKREVYTSNTIDMIHKLKREMPEVKIYGAIDPYRSSIKEEYKYIQHKINAGVEGFFTQPFFDLRMLDIYSDILKGVDFYAGIAPVYTKTSANYWRTKNAVMFPGDFEATKEWNKKIAMEAMEMANSKGFNMYFMPIIVDVVTYLKSILD